MLVNRLILAVPVVGVLLAVAPGAGAPVKEVAARQYDLPGLNQVVQTVELKGLEPTRIIASGNKRYHLGLYVFDAQGNCVAWDDYGGPDVREDCGVVIVPPADGTFTVQVRSFSPQENGVRIVVR